MTLSRFGLSIISRFKKIGHSIGKFQTMLLSSLLYFLLITPIGLIFQLVTFVRQSLLKKQKTYWQSRDYNKDLKDAYQQF